MPNLKKLTNLPEKVHIFFFSLDSIDVTHFGKEMCTCHPLSYACRYKMDQIQMADLFDILFNFELKL